jgi:hypothetical protein
MEESSHKLDQRVFEHMTELVSESVRTAFNQGQEITVNQVQRSHLKP